MISFPNCKINLGLHIIRKREDDYHDLETVFYPISFTDVVEIIDPGVLHLEGVAHLVFTGLPVDVTDNLCIKAYNLLKQDLPQLPAIKMHLHKAIPLGAGLGGGSSDAAFTLQLLNEKFKLNLKTEQLLDYALRLGSDCPFFIINKPCFATGRGEILQTINIDLTSYKLLIINPGIHIDTKWAFSKITPKEPKTSIKEIITQSLETWKEQLKNDFEVPVFEEYPEIGELKIDLYQQGAVYASMSGSGSTVYGIFKKDAAIDNSKWNNYFCKTIDL
ncbi:MAG TPA: 4-(cytidine 5'-diphospho)-2-C-methyl-D-erythritol kinase [Chitinophagaceae bacterium]|nr:4-(cytidine 5'-diphospho)-2-C-methyl-D-erythritol kinase [Chitinophagaceae bacterium]